MLPDHLCRRDIPGLDEAILASEYAKLENLIENEVVESISAHRMLGVKVDGVWLVEAPPLCEERLSQLGGHHPQNTDRRMGEMHANLFESRPQALRGDASLDDIDQMQYSADFKSIIKCLEMLSEPWYKDAEVALDHLAVSKKEIVDGYIKALSA